MKEEFKKYLATIGLTAPTALARVEDAYRVCSHLCPEDIGDIFVEDYVTEDGTRVYEHLEFFSPHFVMDVKNFLSAPDYSVGGMGNGIFALRVRASEYDFQKASDKSRLVMDLALRAAGTPQNVWTFKAARENCDSLWALAIKYFKPNLTG